MSPRENPSRTVHAVCAYWLMSRDGFNAKPQPQADMELRARNQLVSLLSFAFASSLERPEPEPAVPAPESSTRAVSEPGELKYRASFPRPAWVLTHGRQLRPPRVCPLFRVPVAIYYVSSICVPAALISTPRPCSRFREATCSGSAGASILDLDYLRLQNCPRAETKSRLRSFACENRLA
jgi:hypothetical protein